MYKATPFNRANSIRLFGTQRRLSLHACMQQSVEMKKSTDACRTICPGTPVLLDDAMEKKKTEIRRASLAKQFNLTHATHALAPLLAPGLECCLHIFVALYAYEIVFVEILELHLVARAIGKADVGTPLKLCVYTILQRLE